MFRFLFRSTHSEKFYFTGKEMVWRQFSVEKFEFKQRATKKVLLRYIIKNRWRVCYLPWRSLNGELWTCGMGIRDVVDVYEDTLLNVVEVDGDVVDVIWSAEVAIRQCLHVSTLLLKGITWVVSAHYMFCPRGCWLAINVYSGAFVGDDKLSSEVCTLSGLLFAAWCFSWGILYIYN